MYAGGNVAILQFHAKGERKPFRSSLEFPDDADSVFHISHMVVGHFIDEEWPTIEVPHSPISPVRVQGVRAGCGSWYLARERETNSAILSATKSSIGDVSPG